MNRIVGLSMPHWDLGIVGYVSGTKDDIENAYMNIVGRCYPLGFDMLREPKGKVTCILDSLSRGLPVRSIAFQLDPYGIANSLGTQYGINRLIIIREIYNWFLEYLVGNDYMDAGDYLEVDEELNAMGNFMSNVRVGGHAASIASIIASTMGLRITKNYQLSIKTIDLRTMVMDYIAKKISSNQ